MTQKEIEMMAIGINKFMFYSWNFHAVQFTMHNGDITYAPEAIVKTEWTCNTEHMVSKWLSGLKTDEPHAYFSKFYSDLSADNRFRFIKWIMENYNDEQRIYCD